MLQAQLNDETLIVLATLMRKEIEHLRKKEKFFCPACKEEVIIKAGKKVIPHFAHRSLKDCLSSDQGEGPYHEQGKLLLYQWLKSQRLNVELEKYIPKINQRPDLFLSINTKRIAIEYQCARITIEEIHRRNNGYERAGITPIWILGANQFHRTSTYGIKINEFTKQFIHQFSPRCIPTLYYFCPIQKQFAIYQDIYFRSKGQAIGTLQFTPLHRTYFKSLFEYRSLSQKLLYELWKREKRLFRLEPQRHRFGWEREWYNWLYNHQTHRELLPSVIYLPNSLQIQMKSSLGDWQSRICIDLIEKLDIGGQFTLNSAENLLRRHIQNETDYPLLQPTKTAITEYLHLLEQLHVIKQTLPKQYMKTSSLVFHKNVEDALNSDKILMNEMIRNSETNYEHNEVNVRYTK